MKFLPTRLPGVIVIEPDVFRDDRGHFFEGHHLKKFSEAGIDIAFVQDNQSRSVKNTLRGMHLQLTKPQGKLIRVLSGEIFDVAVDLRIDSATFGKWTGMNLSSTNFLQLYIPPGFAHGFLVLSETADVLYKCTDFYDKKDEAGIIWNDPDIGIEWPLTKPILSLKDEKAPRLKQLVDQLKKTEMYRV